MESLVNKQFSRKKKKTKKQQNSVLAQNPPSWKKNRGGHGSRVPNTNDREKDGFDEVSGEVFFFSHGPWARSCFFDVDFERTFLFFFWGGILLAKLENKNATETNYNSNFLREGGIFSRNSLLRLDWIAVEPHV